MIQQFTESPIFHPQHLLYLCKTKELNNIFLLTICRAQALAVKRLILNLAVLGAQSR